MANVEQEPIDYGRKIYVAHLVVGAVVGKPQILTPEQERDLMAQSGPLTGPQHRVKMMEGRG